MEGQQFAKKLRLKALEMAYKSGKNGSHVGGGLSAVEIFAALYGGILKFDVNHPNDGNRDRLVVSKGHCVLAYYSALNAVGFMNQEDLDGFEVDGQHLHGHAFRNLEKGIEFSGGSLSMGMSFAVGQALACKKKGMPSRVYALVGDGECDEGLIWESAMAASNYKLNNLVVIIDCNKLQYDGLTKEVMDNSSLADKFKAFGFDTIEVDGHNVSELTKALSFQGEKPFCIVAHTIKGKGASFAEGHREWHHHILSEDEYNQARKEVEDDNT